MELRWAKRETEPLAGDVPPTLAFRMGLHLKEHAEYPCPELHALTDYQAEEPDDCPPSIGYQLRRAQPIPPQQFRHR